MTSSHVTYLNNMQDLFRKFVAELTTYLQADEVFSVSLCAESSAFTRCTQSKIRQMSMVDQGQITLTLYRDQKTFTLDFPFGPNHQNNLQIGIEAVQKGRDLLSFLPEDPYFTPCDQIGQSHSSCFKSLVDHSEMVHQVLEASQGQDLAGLIVSGPIIKASANSLGMFHWFDTSSYSVDYSLYNSKQDAVKDLYAGQDWNNDIMHQKITSAAQKLHLLNTQQKKLSPGQYRTYFAPSAVSSLLSIMSWHGVSAASLKQGQSSFKDLFDNTKTLSPLFSFAEDFSTGLSPAFNSMGEVAPTQLNIVKGGKLENLLVSKRTATEYGIDSNNAEVNEGLRSTSMNTGTLSEREILSTLGEGLYISDLHYLNWSDFQTGRLTGMTRYACFWVENGQLKAPITNMRFDDSFYSFWGEKLESLTDFCETFPETGTYGMRSLGGNVVPGMLVKSFNLTL